jgi:PKD domain-containing protein
LAVSKVSPRRGILTLALATVLLGVSASPALGDSFPGAVPDVPTGTHLPVPRASARGSAAALDYQGGSVLHSNRTHVIYWQPRGSGLQYDPGYQALVERFLSSVAADSRKPTNVYSLSGQYHDSGGPAAYNSTYKGAVLTTDALPPNGCVLPPTAPPWSVCLSESQLQAKIAHVVAVNHLPTQASDIYFLVTPNGFGSCRGTGPEDCSLGGSAYNGVCAWHLFTPDRRILYANIPYGEVPPHCQSGKPRPNGNPADETVSYLSHEHIEILTDPYVSSWADPSGMEIGDVCQTSYGRTLGGSGGSVWNQSIHGGRFYLQQEYSNDNGGCASRDESDHVSFSTRHAKARKKLKLSGHAHDSDGRIVAWTWFFGDGKLGHRRVANHKYKQRGVYRVTLRTTDSSGNWAFSGRNIHLRR